VQVVSSTNGDLLQTEDNRQEGKAGTPLHAQQPEVEVVEETKYVPISVHLFTRWIFYSGNIAQNAVATTETKVCVDEGQK